MQGLRFNAVITGIRAKVDGSLGLTLGTPELTIPEKAAIMELQNQPVDLVIAPLDEPSAEIVQIDKELGHKTIGQRLRNVMYVYHQQFAISEDFDTWHKKYMEDLIDKFKSKLD